VNKKIIFCFPYKKGAGGVNMMFMRLASYLGNQKYDVALVDYIDGDMAKNKDENVDLIPYFDDDEVLIPTNSILIFQTMTPWSLYPSLKVQDSINIFFITTLPANFYPVLPGFLRNIMYEGGIVAKLFWNTLLLNEYNKSKQFLKLIEEKNSHAILDSDIVCNLMKSLNTKITNPKLLPLFSQDVKENEFLKKGINDSNILNIGWVGRLADFKINILNHTMQNAFEYANSEKEKINFVVVGDGEYADQLFAKESEYFSITKISYVKPSELNSFMLTLDILFAMGTTALDGAKLGVPTVRLDYSYSQIPKNYKYKFFHEVRGYSMGEKMDSDCFVNGLHDFRDLINIFHQDKKQLSELGFDFYKSHHSIDSSSNLLLNYIQESSLRWSDLIDNNLMNSLFYDVWKKFRSK